MTTTCRIGIAFETAGAMPSVCETRAPGPKAQPVRDSESESTGIGVGHDIGGSAGVTIVSMASRPQSARHEAPLIANAAAANLPRIRGVAFIGRECRQP